MKVKFREWDCELQITPYPNGRPALLLTTPEGERIVTATVDMPGFLPTEGQVLVKNYSENRGLLDALVEAGVVRDTGVLVNAGFAQVSVCDLLVDPPWKARQTVRERMTRGRGEGRSRTRGLER